MKNKKGFSMIELVVVITLLGVVSLIAIPAFKNIKEDSREKICKENIENMLDTYRQEKTTNPELQLNDFLTDLKGSEEFKNCPSGGQYMLSVNGKTIVCTKHGGDLTNLVK